MDIFFILLAVLNEIVWRTQSEEFWINFKVWGILPLTFVFTAFQIPLIKKYKKMMNKLKLIVNNKFYKKEKFFH